MLNHQAVEQVAELLRGVPLLAGLPQAELAWIAAGIYQRAYRPGALISREGERSRFFSILLEGEIAVIKSLGQPEERLLTVMRAGDFFGEMSLFDDGSEAAEPAGEAGEPGEAAPGNQRAASLVAHSLAVVLELPAEHFKALLNRQPGLALRVMEVMASRLRGLENATIQHLRERNRRLSQALHDLQAAQAQLVEKEKLEHELTMARRIQERILPKELPELPGWQVQARWLPARLVSGDFYDFLSLPDGRLGVVIGDVSGKGVPAALVMATTCSVLRATARTLAGRRRSPGRRRTGTTGFFQNPFKSGERLSTGDTGMFVSPFKPGAAAPQAAPGEAGQPGAGAGPNGAGPNGAAASGAAPAYPAAPLSPASLLAQVNDLLCRDMPPGMFAACLFGLLDPASGEFRFANAGHCLPLLRRPDGSVQALRATGMPLGLLPEREYDETTVTLGPGDRLLLYSDGLVEAHAPSREMFGEPRLHQSLSGLDGELIDGLLGRLAGFTGPGWEAEDDVTLVTVARGAGRRV